MARPVCHGSPDAEPRPVIGPGELGKLQRLIAEAGVDGWLLFDFRGRNPITPRYSASRSWAAAGCTC